jgi:DNA replication protein DnaC
MRVLSRKTKNNPVLIGEPGVGKTAVVEGLAQGIVKGNDEPGLSRVPRRMRPMCGLWREESESEASLGLSSRLIL